MLISFHEFELYKKVIKEVSLCLPILSSPFYLFRGNHPHCFLVYPSWISFCKNLKKKHFALFSPSSSQKKVRYMLYMLFCMWLFSFLYTSWKPLHVRSQQLLTVLVTATSYSTLCKYHSLLNLLLQLSVCLFYMNMKLFLNLYELACKMSLRTFTDHFRSFQGKT